MLGVTGDGEDVVGDESGDRGNFDAGVEVGADGDGVEADSAVS